MKTFTGTIPGWIGKLSWLSILILKFNHFEGKIPNQICQLKELSILDLFENNFSGIIPPCFSDIPYKSSNHKSFVVGFGFSIYNFVDSIYWREEFQPNDEDIIVNIVTNQVEFMTKHGYYAYKGLILDYMPEIDLSCNHVTGKIPTGIGNLG